MWGGLKGAVPILLATFVLLAHVDRAQRIYDIVFIVVAFSVIVQGTSIPFVAPRLGVPMRIAELRGIRRFVVAPNSYAVGMQIRELPLGERTWIQEIVRDSRRVRARGSTTLRAGDEVAAVISDVEDTDAVDRIFGGAAD
jgi:cell volume regulation protein A